MSEHTDTRLICKKCGKPRPFFEDRKKRGFCKCWKGIKGGM